MGPCFRWDDEAKKAPVETGARSDCGKQPAYLSVRCLSAVPRMSPSVAPESEEPILRDGLLLFGDFQRLDRDLHLAGLLVELDHPRVDLFAHRKTLGALIVAITGQFGPLDEGGEIGTGDLHLDPRFLHLEALRKSPPRPS